MKEIRLYGPLRERFGGPYFLNVHSPAEALRALACQLRGFRAYFYQHRNARYRVWAGTGRRTAETLRDPCSSREIIRIAPVVAGSGDVGEFLAGVAIAYFLPGVGFLTDLGLSAATATTLVSSLGWSLAIAGVSSMLAPKIDPLEAPAAPENNPSFIFNGAVNVIRQGGPVPLAYGRIVVGSVTVSAGLYAAQIYA